LYKSTDSGQTFNGLGNNVHPDHHALVFPDLSNPNRIYDASDGGFAFSGDGGSTWNSGNSDLQITGFQSISWSPLTARIIGGTQDNGTEMWAGSRVWQHIDDGDSASTIMDLDDANQMYDVYARQCPRRGSAVLGSFTPILNGLGVTSTQCFSSFVYPEDSAFYPPVSQ